MTRKLTRLQLFDLGHAQDGQERGEHRDRRDQQRHEGEQRGEDEQQHRQRADAADQDLVQDAEPAAGAVGLQRLLAGDPHRRPERIPKPTDMDAFVEIWFWTCEPSMPPEPGVNM